MAILKNKTQSNFVMVSQNITHDNKLSLTERGLLLTLLSLPDGWNLSVAGLKIILPDGKDKISHALNKLIEYGYVTRQQGRGGNGKFGSNILEVHSEPVGRNPGPPTGGKEDEKPLPENPSSVKPSTDKPSAENLPQYNNKYINNQDINNQKSNIKKCVSKKDKATDNPSDTLDDSEYQSLVNEFGKELVDYTISRIREYHYKGCMNYSRIHEWCSEYISRKPVNKPGSDCANNKKIHSFNERSYSKEFFESLLSEIG